MIITIAREDGSGGRELGVRLAEALGIPCYDKEIIREVAELHGIPTERVEKIGRSNVGRASSPIHGRSFFSRFRFNDRAARVIGSEETVIRRLASQGACVIIGRAADAILSDMNPFKIFVYADEGSKLRRLKGSLKQKRSDKALLNRMKKIDRERADLHRAFSDTRWGDPKEYHLLINTTGVSVTTLVQGVVAYIKNWNEAKINHTKHG